MNLRYSSQLGILCDKLAFTQYTEVGSYILQNQRMPFVLYKKVVI